MSFNAIFRSQFSHFCWIRWTCCKSYQFWRKITGKLCICFTSSKAANKMFSNTNATLSSAHTFGLVIKAEQTSVLQYSQAILSLYSNYYLFRRLLLKTLYSLVFDRMLSCGFAIAFTSIQSRVLFCSPHMQIHIFTITRNTRSVAHQ